MASAGSPIYLIRLALPRQENANQWENSRKKGRIVGQRAAELPHAGINNVRVVARTTSNITLFLWNLMIA
jgi:hypothetical protein